MTIEIEEKTGLVDKKEEKKCHLIQTSNPTKIDELILLRPSLGVVIHVFLLFIWCSWCCWRQC